MKKFLLCFIFCGLGADSGKQLTTAGAKPGARVLLDEVRCIVHGPEETEIICDSDTKKAGLGGASQQDLEELIDEKLICQHALQLKIPTDNLSSIVDNYLSSIKEQFKLSEDKLEQSLKEFGYTIEEARDKLKSMYVSRSMITMLLEASIVVTDQEVMAFYQANPKLKEPKFQIQRGFVTNTEAQNLELFEKQLASYQITGTGPAILWYDPYWISSSNLSEQLSAIKTMDIDYICKPRRIAGGFEFYKLLQKKPERVVPLNKRYKEIVEELKQKKLSVQQQEYKKKLRDGASIIYYNNAV
jgi:parvulin-like peptidyl-prolyl isomerase